MEVCGFLNDTALVQFRVSPREGAGAKPLLYGLAPRDHFTALPGTHEDLAQPAPSQPSLS